MVQRVPPTPSIETWKLLVPGFVVVALIIMAFAAIIALGQKMSRSFAEEPEETMVGISEEYANKPIKVYHIKSSYNSCASGDYANDFVSLAALQNVIKNGCRFLDFEIYDINDEPVVAVSTGTSNDYKTSFNSIPLPEVFKIVKKKAFSTHNGRDPLFLQFRVRSAHVKICNKIAKLINLYFGNVLMDNQYNYENSYKNMANIPLSAFIGKVCIIFDTKNRVYKESSLAEFVNIGANDVFNRVMTYNDLALNPPSDILDYSKENLLTCIPDSMKADNYDSSAAFNQGAQFIAMKFQTNDANLALYNEHFGQYAFLMKPEELQTRPNLVRQAAPMTSTSSAEEVISSVQAGANTTVIQVPNFSEDTP